MDCRKALASAFCLLTGVLGCAHDSGNAAPAPPPETKQPPLAMTTSAYAPIKRDADIVKRMPQPSTCVQAGNFFAGEAVALDKGSNAQELTRDRARRAYQQALTIDPNNLSAYQGLARLYIEMDDFEHAIATYQKALQVQPRSAVVWFERGMCEARHKNWNAAIESLTHAVEFDTENRQYVNTLGFTLARAGQYQASLDCFSRQNNEEMAYFKLGQMLHQMHQDDKCRLCLQAALHKNPKLEQARTLLAQLKDVAPAAVRTVNYTPTETAPAQPTEPQTFQPIILPAPPPTICQTQQQ